jgi:hypothetical protein
MKQPDDGSKHTAYLKTVNVVFVTRTGAVSFNSLLAYKNTRNKTRCHTSRLQVVTLLMMICVLLQRRQQVSQIVLVRHCHPVPLTVIAIKQKPSRYTHMPVNPYFIPTFLGVAGPSAGIYIGTNFQ